MAKKLCVASVLIALVVAGDSLRAQDARGVLQAAVKAMGADNVRTIQYSGTGWNAGVGQSFSPQDDWPRFEVTRYTRTIDYNARYSREEVTRRQGNNPPRGGGGTPLQGEQQQDFLVSGNYAWNMNGQNPVPQPGQYLAGICGNVTAQSEQYLIIAIVGQHFDFATTLQILRPFTAAKLSQNHVQAR